MIPEAPFLFSIAGLSASMAGLAGLVAGLRRSTDVRPIDAFRLRQIVEFSFASILLAVSLMPLTTLMPTPEAAVRLVSSPFRLALPPDSPGHTRPAARPTDVRFLLVLSTLGRE